MPTRGVIAEPQAARAAAVPAEQVGGDAGLIEEDVAARVVHGLRVLPAAPRGGDVSAPLFVGVDGFFDGKSQPPDGAPDRAQRRRGRECLPQLR
jgi:hypothetical protein